mmetsp:Transcript_76490/g.234075  ORF Transcript_76490/g.234075 Transcript_76490/m.234075 type:complete len:273 (-) Transcript_76490:260-1078(-)
MLHLTKNSLVTGVSTRQVELRQLEADWYINNYASLTLQSTMLAGFAFAQITTPMPEDHMPPLILEFAYLFMTCSVIGLELSVILVSAFLTVWAPSLGLRGKNGLQDVHRMVSCLADYHGLTFLYFIVGWILFFCSCICQIWIYYPRRVATVVTVPMVAFLISMGMYSASITSQLKLDERHVVSSKMGYFVGYEFVGDIDSHMSSSSGARDPRSLEVDSFGHCPVRGIDGPFQPRLASERQRANESAASSSSGSTIARNGRDGQPPLLQQRQY